MENSYEHDCIGLYHCTEHGHINSPDLAIIILGSLLGYIAQLILPAYFNLKFATNKTEYQMVYT